MRRFLFPIATLVLLFFACQPEESATDDGPKYTNQSTDYHRFLQTGYCADRSLRFSRESFKSPLLNHEVWKIKKSQIMFALVSLRAKLTKGFSSYTTVVIVHSVSHVSPFPDLPGRGLLLKTTKTSLKRQSLDINATKQVPKII